MGGADLLTYRIDRLTKRVDAVEAVIVEVQRLRRDGAVAVAVLLVALAVSSPQVWAIVLGYVAAIVKMVKSWSH